MTIVVVPEPVRARADDTSADANQGAGGYSPSSAPMMPEDAATVERKITLIDDQRGDYESTCPPSTTNVCPVIQLARSEARNRATLATSSGPPKRPNGMDPSVP